MSKPALTDRVLAVLTQNRGRLVGFARHRLGDADPGFDAEDVVSDVVLRLLERGDVVGEIENLTAYLYEALSNRITDLFRRRRDVQMPETPPEPLSPRNLDDQMAVGQALSLLTTAERALWLAIEMDGYSFRELAALWKVPVGTLLSRKARASKRMRQALAEVPVGRS